MTCLVVCWAKLSLCAASLAAATLLDLVLVTVKQMVVVIPLQEELSSSTVTQCQMEQLLLMLLPTTHLLAVSLANQMPEDAQPLILHFWLMLMTVVMFWPVRKHLVALAPVQLVQQTSSGRCALDQAQFLAAQLAVMQHVKPGQVLMSKDGQAHSVSPIFHELSLLSVFGYSLMT